MSAVPDTLVLIQGGAKGVGPDADRQRRRIELAIVARARNLHRVGRNVTRKPIENRLNADAVFRQRLVKESFEIGRSCFGGDAPLVQAFHIIDDNFRDGLTQALV